jgi:aspartate aminotransferase-like enzyme
MALRFALRMQAHKNPRQIFTDKSTIKNLRKIRVGKCQTWVFRTDNALTMPISAPGSAGMETCFVNLVEPGDETVMR